MNGNAQKTCEINDCYRKPVARGMCSKHYVDWTCIKGVKL